MFKGNVYIIALFLLYIIVTVTDGKNYMIIIIIIIIKREYKDECRTHNCW